MLFVFKLQLYRVFASTGCVCPSQTFIQTRGTPPGPSPPSSQVCSASWWRKAPPLAALRPLTTPWAPNVTVEHFPVICEIHYVHVFLFSRKDSCRHKAWPLTSRIRCSVSCFLMWSKYVSLISGIDYIPFSPHIFFLSAGLTFLSCSPPGDEAETKGPGRVKSPHTAPPFAWCGPRWWPPASPLWPPCRQRSPCQAARSQPCRRPATGQSQPWTSGWGISQPVCDCRLRSIRLHCQIRAEEHSPGVRSIRAGGHTPHADEPSPGLNNL